MNDYLLQSAINTLRDKAEKAWASLLTDPYGGPWEGSRIRGMEDSLKIIEDMLYEDLQMRIETACA